MKNQLIQRADPSWKQGHRSPVGATSPVVSSMLKRLLVGFKSFFLKHLVTLVMVNNGYLYPQAIHEGPTGDKNIPTHIG